MRGALLSVVAMGLSASAALSDCTGDGEVTLFGCATEDGSRTILLCGVESDPDDPQRYLGLRYELITLEGVELSYPQKPANASKLMFYSHWFENGLLRANLRFENGAFTYRLYWESNPPSTAPDEISAPNTGIEVLQGGKVVTVHECGEDPEWYFDTTRRSAACDLENPYGERACASDGPEVK